MTATQSIDLNQSFSSFLDVQAFFGDAMSGFSLASEWTTCTEPIVLVQYKGQDWLVILKQSDVQAPEAAIAVAQRCIHQIKMANDSVRSAIFLETKVGGAGRYEWDVFYANPFGNAIAQLQNLASLCCKNGVNLVDFLVNIGYESPLAPSQKALEWA